MLLDNQKCVWDVCSNQWLYFKFNYPLHVTKCTFKSEAMFFFFSAYVLNRLIIFVFISNITFSTFN